MDSSQFGWSNYNTIADGDRRGMRLHVPGCCSEIFIKSLSFLTSQVTWIQTISSVRKKSKLVIKYTWVG